MTTLEQKISDLETMGFKVGERDPAINSAFNGKFMVVEDYGEGPSDSASGYGYRIVGDHLNTMIERAWGK